MVYLNLRVPIRGYIFFSSVSSLAPFVIKCSVKRFELNNPEVDSNLYDIDFGYSGMYSHQQLPEVFNMTGSLVVVTATA